MEFLADCLNVNQAEIRSLLAELILEEKIKGSIDQITGVLELNQSELKASRKNRAFEQWGETVLELHKKLTKKLVYDPRGSEGGYEGMGSQMMF